MVKQIEREIERDVAYYYDSNPTEEDLVLESTIHRKQAIYLALVLEWHLRDQDYSVYGNLGFYSTSHHREHPLAPDVVLVKGGAFQDVRSWKIGSTGLAPLLVVEIGSLETWGNDLDEKPSRYALMGVEEYFAYDPNKQPLKKYIPRRLYGWQLDKAVGQMKAIPVGPDGRLWSSLLGCFLVPDGEYLRLYDSDGHMLLTGEEAQEQAKLVEKRRADAEKRRADAEAKRAVAEARAKQAEKKRADEEKRRADAEAKRADAEARAKQAEKKRADEEKKRADAEAGAKRTEARRADVEKKRADALAEKLRSLGIEPNGI